MRISLQLVECFKSLVIQRFRLTPGMVCGVLYNQSFQVTYSSYLRILALKRIFLKCHIDNDDSLMHQQQKSWAKLLELTEMWLENIILNRRCTWMSGIFSTEREFFSWWNLIKNRTSDALKSSRSEFSLHLPFVVRIHSIEK